MRFPNCARTSSDHRKFRLRSQKLSGNRSRLEIALYRRSSKKLIETCSASLGSLVADRRDPGQNFWNADFLKIGSNIEPSRSLIGKTCNDKTSRAAAAHSYRAEPHRKEVRPHSKTLQLTFICSTSGSQVYDSSDLNAAPFRFKQALGSHGAQGRAASFVTYQ